MIDAADARHRRPRAVRPAPTSAGRSTRRRYESRAIDSFLDLNEGDLVVHVNHGIARYRGLQLVDKAAEHAEETLLLEFAEGTQAVTSRSPRSTWCRSTSAAARPTRRCRRSAASAWEKRKEQVAEAVVDLAAELIDIQAARGSQPGIAYPAEDSHWRPSSRPPSPTRRRPTSSPPSTRSRRDMAQAPADGPPDLRRRRLRQDRGRHPRRVQGGRRRQAGRRARADDRPGRAALPHLHASGWPSSRSSIEVVSRFRPQARDQRRPQAAGAGRRRHPHRHAPARSEGRRSSRTWAWSSSTRSSGSASSTRSGSRRCGRRWTC